MYPLLKNLTFQIVISAIFGIGLAFIYEALLPSGSEVVNNSISFLKDGFLALLKMLIAPMIFFSLLGGIISLGNVVQLRRLGGITVSYYLFTTGIAITLALIAVVFVHPWTAYPPIMGSMIETANTRLLEPGSDSILEVLSTMTSLAFTNPFSALANLNILGIVANAIFIGIAMVFVLDGVSPLFRFVEDVNKIIIQVVQWVIRVLPVGIFAILFDFTMKLSGDDGLGGTLLIQLLQFGILVVSITLIHGVIVLPTIAWITTKTSPLELLKKTAGPLIVAFSTSSSATTLPLSMQTAQEKLDVAPSVSSFVLPLGATMNMDGTALFEAVAAIFLAYLYGIELSSIMMVTIFFMAMVASIGAPGMPSASMSGMQMVMLAIGIPLEAIALLLVVERPLDTIRTSVNVEGDLVGSLVVDRYLKR